ncbi:MAG TPA: sigma factor-like helix-turn-helix DNA-binding protein [Actinomycetota bacterium]|nr:sigma factor-like helix-turn-helix DNA-binding protein [Actinomycetota bacterium]
MARATTTSRVDELYVRHVPMVGAMAFLLTGSRREAEDLVHEAFLRLVGRFEHVRRPHAFASSLRGETVRLHLSPLRTLRPQTRRAAGGSASANDVPGDPTAMDLWEALRALPRRQRAALVLRFHQDLSPAGTADLLRCSVATARSLAFRGIRALAGPVPATAGTTSEVEPDLRTTLAAWGESVLPAVPAPVPRDVRRRMRRREASGLARAAVVMAVLVAGAALTAPRVLPHVPPIRAQRVPDPTTQVQRTMVASGVERGARWRVFAAWRPAAEHLCVEVETVGSERTLRASTCFRDAASRPVSHVTAGAGPPFVYAGTVSEAVDEVTFESRSGRTGTARLVDAAPTLERRLRMFVALVGEPGTVIFTARDVEGRVLVHHGSAPADA